MNYTNALVHHERIKRTYTRASRIKKQRDSSWLPTGGELSIAKALEYGTTYFISREIFLRLVDGPVTSVPLDTRITPDMFPTPQGVVIFDASYSVNRKVKIGGIVWDANTMVVTPPDAARGSTAQDRGVMICSMEVPALDLQTITPLDPTYYATWRYKHSLRESLEMNMKWSTDDSDPDSTVTNAGHRFIATFLRFIQDEIITHSREKADKKARQQLRKNGWKHPGTVNVVRLRKIKQQSNDNDEHASRDWTCRWYVRGFWRNQRVGPGRKETKRVWVDSFIKGPANKPLRSKTTVFEVSR